MSIFCSTELFIIIYLVNKDLGLQYQDTYYGEYQSVFKDWWILLDFFFPEVHMGILHSEKLRRHSAVLTIE